jgi:localization factor PodJL
MNKPNYRQLRAEIQNLSRSRARAAKAPDRRSDAWRAFDDEDAAEDDFFLEDDETAFSIDEEEDDPFGNPPLRVSRHIAANERNTTRALHRIAQLVDESRNSIMRSRGLDQALDALSRSISASERRTARALETIVAELVEDDPIPSAAERRRRRARRAAPLDAPARNFVPEPESAVDDLDRAPEDIAERPESAAPRSGQPESRRAETESSVVKLPLADAVLDITRRQQALDAGADARDAAAEAPRAPAVEEGGAGRLEEIERVVAATAKNVESLLGNREDRSERANELGGEIDKLRRQIEDATCEEHPALSRRFGEVRGEIEALERQMGSLRGDFDNSAERERHIMLQVDGLREEIRSLTRGVGELAPRASIEAIERALADLAERVAAQRARGVEDQALAPAGRIAGELRAVLEEIDPRPQMRVLETDVRGLAERLDRLEAAGDADAVSLQELGRRTAEIRETLSSLAARPLPQEQIETRLRDLTIRVDKLSAGHASGERSSDVADAAKAIRAILSAETGLDAFHQRLDRLSDKLEEALARFDGNRFDELGARIDEMHQSLAERIDQGILQASPNVALEGLLADLAKKVDHALSVGSSPVASLEGKVDRLDEKLDRLGQGPLAEQLEELLARAKPQEHGRLDEITERLDVMQRTLATQFDESVRWRKDDSHKAQLSALLEQLAQRSAEAFGPGADPAAVNALGEQVRQLSARLDRSLNDSATLASIESKIAELCEKIGDSRAGAAQSAEKPARRAEPSSVKRSEPAPPRTLESQLEALDGLLESQEAISARAQEATTAQDAPEGVADRSSISQNERSWSEAPERTQAESVESAPAAAAFEAPRFQPLVVHSAPQRGRRRHDGNDLDSDATGAPDPARFTGVDLELKQQADFIAAARRAAERAGVDAVPPRDRKISIKELETSRAPHFAPQMETNAPVAVASSRKTLMLAGLTGVAILAAAAPIGRSLFEPSHSGSAVEARATGAGAFNQKFALNAPSSLVQNFSAAENDAAETKSASDGVGFEATRGAGDGAAAKPDRKNVATERVDPTPVGAIEKTPAALPLEMASLQALAQRGDPKAQFELGVRYAEGRGGVARDSKLAAEWFYKAADQGLPLAQYRLGSFYEKGIGVERDFDRARSLYEKAASAGNARAMHNLGVLFVENGDGWPDYASAAGWFRKAAEFGVRDSQFNLAVLYARGMGVEQNLVQSYMWFSVAAARGDPESARKRDEVAARLDVRDLATAKSMAEAFKPKELARDANEAETPRSAGPALNPSAKQPDAPTAAATSKRPKISGM